MIEKLGIIVVYFYLTMINVWGFSKLDTKHEANFHLRFLFKRIGVKGTQILTMLVVSIVVLILPMTHLFEGILLGLFLFNAIHDYYTIMAILRGKKNE